MTKSLILGPILVNLDQIEALNVFFETSTSS